MLPDGWELQYGLSPCECATPNDLSWDADGDGLGLFDEYRYCTDPFNPDTDGDGVRDGDEVPHSPGSCPNDPDDEGNPANCVTLSLTVGDPSGSHSERWNFEVFEEATGRDVVRHCDDGFGTPGSAEYALVKGKAYTFSLRWIDTNLDEGPDYDWQALINDSDETGACEGLYGTGAFIVEDSYGLLTEERHGDEFDITIGETGRIIVPKVEALDVTSPKSGTSGNPPPFEGHRPWPFDVTKSPNPDRHMVVFYKDVVDSAFNVEDFDVTLKANVLPADITADRLDEAWSKISGPASGSLNRTDTFEVKYQNPKVGGVYRFDFDLGGGVKSEANLVLPLAGAEMDGAIQADLLKADAFATAVKAKYIPRELKKMKHMARWFWTNHVGDYTGRPDNADTPTAWVHNQVNDESGFGAVCTWRGRPVRLTKPSNFILGYAMQQIGISRAKARRGTGLFTITETTDRASVGAGWDVANGGNYDTIVSDLVDYIWTHEVENDKSRKLWPNPNPPDNYKGSSSDDLFNYSTGYGAPGFLFMTQ